MATTAIKPIPGGILEVLSTHSQKRHPHSDTVAAIAPEEEARVPMVQRGVTLALLRRVVLELAALGRTGIDTGQYLNGEHTTSSETDWKEFDRSRDNFSGKACTLHTGLSVVETMMAAGLTHDPITGEPYFGTIDTFIRLGSKHPLSAPCMHHVVQTDAPTD